MDFKSYGMAVRGKDAFIHRCGSNRNIQRTIKVWILLIKWKDGTSTWERLNNL